MARDWPQEDVNLVNKMSWYIASRPDGSRDEYDRAVRLAEEACRRAPNAGMFINTLGVAQYRIGDFAKAVETLTRSDAINSKPPDQSRPEDVAFLAMAHHQLGHVDEAKKLLDHLRAMLQQPTWKDDAEVQRFLREAETLIEGKKQPRTAAAIARRRHPALHKKS